MNLMSDDAPAAIVLRLDDGRPITVIKPSNI
jgi:hypothetical protein